MTFATLGIDHGTQAIRFCILPENVLFELERSEALNVSVIKEIEKHFPIEKIDIVGVTYSMGDGIDKITNIRKVKSRGVLEKKVGKYVGGGTKVFDEIASSGMKAVVIPGLHRNLPVLDQRFRALYSHCASAEKVSLCYHCYLRINKEMDAQNIIVSDISSNTVTIGIKNGKFFGAIDACLGAIGLMHGPLDLETIEKIDAGKITAHEAFYSSGAIKISDSPPEEILSAKSEKDKLAIQSLVMSAKMEALSFLGEIEPHAFVITGLAGIHENVFPALRESLERFAPVFKINGYSAAIGSAEIARDILGGRRDFLGIGVEY